MKNVYPLLLGISIVSCTSIGGPPKLFGVKPVCDGLYREKFRAFSGGAWSAELYDDYLTDSINFRLYIGRHDDRESFAYKCVGDTIVVQKFTHHESKPKTIQNQKKYSLTTLRKEHEFDDTRTR